MKGIATTALLAGAAGILFASTAQAAIVLNNGESVNLGWLMNQSQDRQVIIDDKLFTFESFGSNGLRANDFRVVGFIGAGSHGNGLNNVGFDITGPFGDTTPGADGMNEMNIQYSVEVLPEFYERGVRLCDTRLTFNGSSGGAGSFARVDETIIDLDFNNYLGTLSAYDTFGPPQDRRLFDAIDFCDTYGTSGYRAFEINKDLKFFAATENGFSSASFVRQEFSQVYVPGPGSLALLALAAIGARRRRS
jgi:hypothetical protein